MVLESRNFLDLRGIVNLSDFLYEDFGHFLSKLGVFLGRVKRMRSEVHLLNLLNHLVSVLDLLLESFLFLYPLSDLLRVHRCDCKYKIITIWLLGQ